MATVKQELRDLDYSGMIQYMTDVEAALTNNATFATPPLTDIGNGKANLQSKLNARNAAQDALNLAQTDLEQALTDARTTMSSAGSYVQSTSGGDEAKIISAGMKVQADAAPITTLPAPGDLSATAGDQEGEIDLDWDRVKGSKSYEVQKSADASNWQHAGVATKSKMTVSGLTSGTKYWFRVRAIGSRVNSPWSDPATKVAP